MDELLREAGVEHRRIVGIDRDVESVVQQHLHGVLGHAGRNTEAHVAGGANLEGDLSLPKFVYQGAILQAPDAVTDATRAERAQRTPNALGSLRFPSMGDARQPRSPCAVERVGKLFGRMTALQPTQAKSHHAVTHSLNCPVGDHRAVTRVDDAGDVDHDAHRDAVFPLCPRTCTVESGQLAFECQALLQIMCVRGVCHLTVPDVL